MAVRNSAEGRMFLDEWEASFARYEKVVNPEQTALEDMVKLIVINFLNIISHVKKSGKRYFMFPTLQLFILILFAIRGIRRLLLVCISRDH
jgi:hypothetical protein